jgi:hypothetical protein
MVKESDSHKKLEHSVFIEYHRKKWVDDDFSRWARPDSLKILCDVQVGLLCDDQISFIRSAVRHDDRILYYYQFFSRKIRRTPL